MRSMPLILRHRADRRRAGPPAAARRRFCSACSARWCSSAGPPGIGMIWGCAGIGLLCGGVAGLLARRPRLSFRELQARHRDLLHRARRRLYPLQPDAQFLCGAGFHRAVARRRWRVSSVLNMSQLLRHVPNEFRGRVFSTMESMDWSRDDGFDDARRHRFAILRPARDRRGRGRAELHHRDFLGAGPTDRPVAGAAASKAWSRRRSRCMENQPSSLAGQSNPGDRRGQAHRPRHRAAAGRGRRARGIHYSIGIREPRGDGGGVRRRAAFSRQPGKRRRDRAHVRARWNSSSAAWTAW